MKSLVTDDMKLLLTSRDAATICGCSTRVWRAWNVRGYTPQPVVINKMLFWRYKELEQWVAAGCPKREFWINQNRKK